MANIQGQLLPSCFSCNTEISGRTNTFHCKSCDRKDHPRCVRGITVGTYNELSGHWQCRVCTTEQTSAAAGPPHAADPSSGAMDEPTNTASPSEVLLEYLERSKTNEKSVAKYTKRC